MGEYHRDAFIEAHELDEPAETACIARLIDGRDECPLDDGEPALYGMHVYPGNIERLDSDEPPHNQWFDVCGFAKHYGLEISVHGKRWYNLGTTVHIVFYPPERYR